MTVPHPFGLALSGGGFRAAAFHLGVLKRLRELGLLHQVDLLSTVSGGSITGAYWVYWQANRGDTLESQEEWNKFERSLVKFMGDGIRGRMMWRGLFLPTLALELLIVGALFLLGPLSPLWWVALMAAAFIAGYAFWHYRAGSLLAKAYDDNLFAGATLQDQAHRGDQGGKPAHRPRLVMNSTALNSGHPVIFTNKPPESNPGGPQKWFYLHPRIELDPIVMPTETPFATAVAASSCFPGAFTPLKVKFKDFKADLSDTEGWLYQHLGDYMLWLVDGGVFDNQGTYSLLEARCKGLIVSDASATLRLYHRPSTWQLFPPGRGVIFRSQNIIYDRARHLGNTRIAERTRLFHELKRKRIVLPENLDGIECIEDYCYLELEPNVRWLDIPHLSDLLIYLVARIRTDLDRFSSTEISALMFHGYTCLDASLRRHSKDWIPSGAAELKFHSADESTNINWANCDPIYEKKRHTRFVRHLHASNSRNAWWRRLCRLINRCRDIQSFEREAFEAPQALQRKLRKHRLKHPPDLTKLGRGFALGPPPPKQSPLGSAGATTPSQKLPLGPALGRTRQHSTSSPKSEPNAK